MKWLVALLLIELGSVDPGDIAKINSLKSEAKKAYLAGDYKTAIDKYQYLVDSIGVKEEEVLMNLANAYFQSNDTTQAMGAYQPLAQSANYKLKSWANQQLGVINNRQGKFEEALNYFKQSLKADPANEEARYNYEMVKKKLEEQKKQEQQRQDQNKENKEDQKDQQDQNQQQNKDQQKKDQEKKEQEKKDQENKDQQQQQNKDQQDKEKQDQQQEEKEQQEKQQKEIPPSVKDKLKEMNMSEEKAKMILEAMKNQEIQYLQQNKRKATRPKDKGKPDW